MNDTLYLILLSSSSKQRRGCRLHKNLAYLNMWENAVRNMGNGLKKNKKVKLRGPGLWEKAEKGIRG